MFRCPPIRTAADRQRNGYVIRFVSGALADLVVCFHPRSLLSPLLCSRFRGECGSTPPCRSASVLPGGYLRFVKYQSVNDHRHITPPLIPSKPVENGRLPCLSPLRGSGSIPKQSAYYPPCSESCDDRHDDFTLCPLVALHLVVQLHKSPKARCPPCSPEGLDGAADVPEFGVSVSPLRVIHTMAV